MSRVPQANFPKQARSRLTLHRLLSAAEALLDHGGLDAATVPAIAKAAGVSVGVVYRRFPDKDMLLRAVYERFFSTVVDQQSAIVHSVHARNLPLPTLVRVLVRGIAEGYRRKRGLLRSLFRYARAHPDAEFRRAARHMNRQGLAHIKLLLLVHRDQIKHPHPEEAIEFATLAVASVLHLVILEEEPLANIRNPEQVEDELTRMFLGYLGLPLE